MAQASTPLVFTGEPIAAGNGVGQTALWSNVGNINGVAIDVSLEVTAITSGGLVAYSTNGDDASVLFFGGAHASPETTIRYQFFIAGTTTPITIIPSAVFKDIDNEFNETVVVTAADVAAYTLETPNNLTIDDTAEAGNLLVTSSANGSSSTNINILVDFQPTTAIDVTYRVNSGTPGFRAFNFDGNIDIPFNSPLLTQLDTIPPPIPTIDNLVTNNITPTLTGTAEAFSTLTIIVGGATYTMVADGSAQWSLDTATATPDTGMFVPNVNGLNEVAVTSTDAAGHFSSDITSNELLIDTTTPATAPTVISQITSDATPQISGTAIVAAVTSGIADEALTVTVNGVTYSVGADLALTGNNWALTIPSALTDGIYEVVATIADAAGNAISDATITELTIDATVPTVTILNAPIAVNSVAAFTVTVEFSENVTGFIVTELIAVNATVGSFVAVDGNTYTANITPTTGNISLNVAANVAQDIAANNNTAATQITVLYDTAAPTAPTVNTQTTNSTTPTITGTAEANSTVTVVVGGATYTLMATGAGAWTLDTATATPDSGAFAPNVNGINQVVATSTDAAGNVSGNDSSTNELTIDTTVPVMPTVNTLTSSDTTPAITGTTTVAAGETLMVTVNSVTYTVGAELVVSGNNWTLTIPSALANGIYNVTASVTDAAGNVSSDTSSNELTIDTIVPTVSIQNAPIAVNSTTAFSVTIEFSENVSGFIVTELLAVNATVGSFIPVDGNTYTAAITPTGAGNITLNVAANVAQDAAANNNTAAPQVNVVFDNTAPVAPTVNTQITNSVTPTITGIAEAGSTVTIVVAGATYTLTATGAGTWSLNTTTAPDSGAFNPDVNGSNEVVASSTDAAGNVSGNDTSTNELTIDTTAPVMPTVNAQATSDTTPVITGNATVAGDETLTVIVNGVTYSVGADLLLTGNDWTLTIPNALTNGIYNVTATVTDAAGNATSDSTNTELTIDTTAPVAPTVNTQTTNSTTPIITGTAEAASTVTVVVGGATYTLTATGAGVWSLDTATVTPDSGTFAPNVNGSNEVVASSTDAAGNVSANDTSVNELTIDTTAPVVPVVNTQISSDTTPVITGNAAVVGGETLTVTVNSVTYSVGIDLALTGSDWTLTIPLANALADAVYDVTATITDAAGNATSDITATELTVDATAPTVTIMNAPAIVNSTTAFNVSIEFSEDVTDFVVAELLASNATVGNFIVVDGNTYTADITPTGAGDIVLNVAADVAQDIAANNNSVATQVSVVFDNIAPTVAILNAPVAVNSTTAFNVTVEFSEDVTDFVVAELLASNATVGNFIAVDGNTYTADITPTGAGDISLNVAASVAQDVAANNNSAATQVDVVFDNVAPTVAILNAPAIVNSTTAFNVTIEFSEDVSSFDVAELLASNATVGSFVAVDGNTYSAAITPTGAGDIVLNVAADVAQDIAANNNSAATQVDVVFDNVAPAVPTVTAQTTSDSRPAIRGTAIVASGEVLTVVVNGVTYQEGAELLLAGNNWVLIIPAANVLPDGVYDVVATVTDAAGNISSDVSTNELTIDTIAPTVVILNAPAIVTSTNAFNVTVEFSEDVTDFVVTELLASNATVGNFIALDAKTYTADITPTGAGNISLNVAADVAWDADANNNRAATQVDVVFDNSPPATPIVSITEDANNDGILGSDELAGEIDVSVRLPADAVVGDALDVNDGNGNHHTLTLDAADVANGIINVDFPNPGIDAASINASAIITDNAGNISAVGSDSATLFIDTDNDGRRDSEDPDADNDGVPDIFEGDGSTDTDGDGIVDSLDRDSDNDGIPDAVEMAVSGIDSDNDGIDDSFDVTQTGGTDANGDGIDDNVSATDSDSDGTPDYLDKDSDNDGIPDIVEANTSGNDSDGDGIDDSFDVTQTGGNDSNGDGVDDAVKARDTDSDGRPDYLDLDTDNDGIVDATEADTGTDVDGNGIDDLFDVNQLGGPDNNADGINDNATATDTDADGIPDYRDLDSDNDSISDVIEAGLVDDDSNGQLDAGATTIATAPDTDGDGIPDYRDVDSNNDGTNDIVDAGNASEDGNADGSVDAALDTDGDGVPDVIDGNPLTFGMNNDADGDGISNALDRDDDNDGIPDTAEMDANGNDIDSDADGVVDRLDRDSDNDALPDSIEAVNGVVLDANADGVIDNFTDANNDGLHDDIDPGMIPVDSDGDNTADFRDLDSDNDGLKDIYETSGFRNDLDTDDNGMVDNPLDIDQDGFADIVDTSVIGSSPGTMQENPDTDADGAANYRDTDSDNDGYSDLIENTDADGNGVLDNMQRDAGLETAIRGAGSFSVLSVMLMLLLLLLLRSKRLLSSLRITTLFALMVTAFSATAAESDINYCGKHKPLDSDKAEDFEKCFYIGAGWLPVTHVEPQGSASGWSTSDDNDAGYSLFVGWHFKPRWFGELSYADLGEASLSNVNPLITGTEKISYKIPALHVGYFLFDPESRFNVYGKLGVAAIQNEATTPLVPFDKQNSVGISSGIGVQWRSQTSGLFARLAADFYDKDARSIGIMLGYYFGGEKTKAEKPAQVIAEPKLEELVPEVAPIVSPVVIPAFITDADGDGVINEDDLCEHSRANVAVNKTGCSIFQVALEGVNFETNSAALNLESKEILDAAAQTIIMSPNVNIEIQAHTDDVGVKKHNQKLSESRASSVREYLISRGVAADQLQSKGYGELNPVQTNQTEAGRAKNRRVELRVVE